MMGFFDLIGSLVMLVLVIIFCLFALRACFYLLLLLGGLGLVLYGGQLAYTGHPAGWLLIIPGALLLLGMLAGGEECGEFISGWFTPKK